MASNIQHELSLPIQVVAAIIVRTDGCFLLACRPPGKPYPGYWEFPGGKIEPDESDRDALARELHEELGITVTHATPWLTREFRYPHATVNIRFYRVTQWLNEPIARERQQLAWQSIESVTVSPLLPANQSILRALELPPVYVISNVAEMGKARSLKTLDSALRAGMKLLQIREKNMPPEQLAGFAVEVIKMARCYQARVLINENVVLAQTLGADGVHLTSAQLLGITTRPAVNWCGASCHNEEELYQAARLGIDFVTLSPVCPTRSHPGMPVLGWQKFSTLIRDYHLPVYALGGMSITDLEAAQEQGAHGVALMRNVEK
ncbi:MAG: Nudix family hydrolase [Nitrosomonas sp.]|nr:Nudix family hydrolase [Nitrosomonas sp.]